MIFVSTSKWNNQTIYFGEKRWRENSYHQARLLKMLATIGNKIVEALHSNRVTSEPGQKNVYTPPLSPPFKVVVFVVFYR